MGESWIDFVKRVQAEGKKKDKNYSFKQAMGDASKRKSEWKKDGSKESRSSGKKTKKGGKKRKSGTKKRRRSKK